MCNVTTGLIVSIVFSLANDCNIPDLTQTQPLPFLTIGLDVRQLHQSGVF